MTKKAVGRFLWTYDNPNPNTEKQKKILKKACELTSVFLINQ